MKRFDLLFDINVRGTFQPTRKALPHLLESENPHVLTIAPLTVLDHPENFAPFPAFEPTTKLPTFPATSQSLDCEARSLRGTNPDTNGGIDHRGGEGGYRFHTDPYALWRRCKSVHKGRQTRPNRVQLCLTQFVRKSAQVFASRPNHAAATLHCHKAAR